jgi:hypothetical protein
MTLKKAKATWVNSAIELFDTGLTDNARVFTREQLTRTLLKHRDKLRIPRTVTRDRFIETLIENGDLRQVEIKPEPKRRERGEPGSSYQPFVRYLWKDATPAEVALSLRTRSYFSHGTAVRLHALSDTQSATIYVNKEQSPKLTASAALTQDSIDAAFSNPARVSQYVFAFEGERIVLLSGKNTAEFEVIHGEDASGFSFRYTSLERTLFDITVRPAYAGGVLEVLQAYRRARERLSVAKMVTVIRKLDHLYPYHQAVGFYLDRVGFGQQELVGLKRLGLDFNFYLANRIKPTEFDSAWRVFFPAKLPRY